VITKVDHISGRTFHGRKGSVENAFTYSIDYVLLDAENPVASPSLFGRNKGNMTAVFDGDHGGDPKQGTGAKWARGVLDAHDLQTDGRLLLLAQPRVLGHVFNPVSFWLAYDAQDTLRVVIAEVSNTFGDRHSYLCYKDDRSEIGATDILKADKIFHVSPFQPITGGYEFRFDIRDDKIGIWIDYSQGNGGLLATLTGSRKPLTNFGIIYACLRRPFGSRRVLALIHWQAVKLWWKKATFRSRPAPPDSEVSR